MDFRISIDTGGTFTDALSLDEKGNMVTAKVPTTPRDLVRSTKNAIDSLAKHNKLSRKQLLSQAATIVHGTTQGTNVILTRSGPRVGIITTDGHRDILALRRVPKEDMFNWRMPQPEPLVVRYLRTEVKERVDSRGEVRIPLDEESAHRAVAYLKRAGVESIVVAFLWSFLRPEHERRVAEIIKQDFPEAHVTLSSALLHMLGEHERTSTAVISAYIAPAITKYIQTLQAFLDSEGFKGQLLFMQNNGGVETAGIAIEKPATLASSGPAAAPSAAIRLGKLHSEPNLLSVDMGGTSFDIAIIDKGNIITKTESLVANYRFSLPVIDISSIGAGGGSIAWFDSTNTLRVGPKSAGGDPGPACYGAGGEEATVTDADVVLGYISPDYFLGGEMKLRKDLAEGVINEKVAKHLGISVPEAAYAIHRVSNSVMADAVSHSFSRRGYDPRDFVLVAAGSAGPTCALKIAQELSIARVLIPKYAPIYCAFGMQGVDLIHDFTRFYHAVKETLDLEEVKRLYEEMEAEALVILDKESIPEKRRRLERTMLIKYFGQFRDVEVPWPGGPINDASVARGVANFHRKHKELYGSCDEKYPIEFMGFGMKAIGETPSVKLKKIGQGDNNPSQALKMERDVYFEESKGFIRTRVYDGDKLLSGNVLDGPCIVEEKMTNVVIPPTFKMHIDEYGNYITS